MRELRTWVREAVRRGREAAEILKLFIRDATSVTVTSAGPYVGQSTYAASVMNSLGINAVAVDDLMLNYYVAPYDEGRERPVIVFVSPAGLTELNILLDQLRWTGHRIAVVAPSPLPEVIRAKLEGVSFIDLGPGEGPWLLTSLVLTALASSEAGRGPEVRRSRVSEEVLTLEDVIDDLISHYEGVLGELTSFIREPYIVTATPTLWAVAEVLAYSRSMKTRRSLVRPSAISEAVRFINRVLVIQTDVEEYSLRHIRSLSLTAATKFAELRIRTDPLTAPFYGLILVRVIEDLVREA